MKFFSTQDTKFDKKFFDAIIKKQTYLNLLFLIISLPLGILYFIFITTGFLLGILLFIIWIGVPILLFVFKASWKISVLDKKLTSKLLNIQIPAISIPGFENSIQLKEFISYIKNFRTWKILLYLLLKLPVGIISIIPPILISILSGLLIYTPFNAVFGKINIMGIYQTESFIEAIFFFFFCIIIWIGLLNLINWFASVSGGFTKKMLRR